MINKISFSICNDALLMILDQDHQKAQGTRLHDRKQYLREDE